jgi:hypothetical protein
VISSRPPTDSGQHSHERRARRRFVRNLRSRIHNYQKNDLLLLLFLLFSEFCFVFLLLESFFVRKEKIPREREREREKEKVID